MEVSQTPFSLKLIQKSQGPTNPVVYKVDVDPDFGHKHIPIMVNGTGVNGHRPN